MEYGDFFELCRSGSAEDVQGAIQAGADVNAKDNCGVTALMHAAQDNNNPEVIKSLINAGADVNATDNEGNKALDWAAKTLKALRGTDALKLLAERTEK